MVNERPPIPRALRRDILVEAGYRCAIPTCRQQPVDVEHIEDWAKVKEHRFENLIALCPNCHAMKTRGTIDRTALRQVKANLSVLNGRYGDVERRVLQAFADSPTSDTLTLPNGFDVLILYLLRDGYLEKLPFVPYIQISGGAGDPVLEQGPQQYRLTPAGREFVNHWLAGDPL